MAAAVYMYDTYGDALFDQERACAIYKTKDGKGGTCYTFDKPRNNKTGADAINSFSIKLDNSCGVPVAIIHNHPGNSTSFSDVYKRQRLRCVEP